MRLKKTDSYYREFWTWFIMNEKHLQTPDATSVYFQLLDSKVEELGHFVWEIGPGTNKPYAFTLSPNSIREKLLITKQIVDLAPQLDYWEFYSFKQPKKRIDSFEIITDNGVESIDVSKWEYVLLKYDDGFFEMDVKPVGFPDKFNSEIYGICEMVVTSLVGEAVRLDKFDRIEVVNEFDLEHTSKTSLLKHLPLYLKSIGIS